MYLAGELIFKGPGLKKEEFIINRKDAAELIVNHREGPVPEIEDFDAWVQMDKDDEISIETNLKDDDDTVYDDLYIEVKSKNGGGLSLSVSAKQAETLARIFLKYAEIRAGMQELAKTVRI